MPLFSVVIPTHDRPSYLAEAVASVLRQTVDDLECLVIDDGGTIEPVLPSDRRVRAARLPENRGPGAARNLGVQLATGRYVTFLDDDDVYTSDRLELGLEAIARAPVALCWGAWMEDAAAGGRDLDGNVHDTILDQTSPSLGTVTISRSDFIPFDESYPASAELPWWLDMTQTWQVATASRIGVRQRRHDAPRHLLSRAARITASQRLLSEREAYFAAHRRARAFRHLRIGLDALAEDRHGLAARSFARSFRSRPSTRALWHLARTAARSGQPSRLARRKAAAQRSVSTGR